MSNEALGIRLPVHVQLIGWFPTTLEAILFMVRYCYTVGMSRSTFDVRAASGPDWRLRIPERSTQEGGVDHEHR